MSMSPESSMLRTTHGSIFSRTQMAQIVLSFLASRSLPLVSLNDGSILAVRCATRIECCSPSASATRSLALVCADVPGHGY